MRPEWDSQAAVSVKLLRRSKQSSDPSNQNLIMKIEPPPHPPWRTQSGYCHMVQISNDPNTAHNLDIENGMSI